MTQEENGEVLEEARTRKKSARKDGEGRPASAKKKRPQRPDEAQGGEGAPRRPPERPAIPAEALESIREQLLTKRDSLARQQATQLRALYSADKHHLADLEEMASDTHETDSLCASVDLSSSTIEQIDGALERLRDGIYGICERCSRAIAPERLEALPFVSLCLDCQRKKEERQARNEDWEE